MGNVDRDRLVGLATAFSGHVGHWSHAVRIQFHRIQSHPPTEEAIERWVDAELFAVALRDLIRACWACRLHFQTEKWTPFEDAVNAFEDSVPHARDVRNQLEHFDKYEESGENSVWIAYSEVGEFSLHVGNKKGEFELDAVKAYNESQVMAEKCLKALDRVLHELLANHRLPELLVHD